MGGWTRIWIVLTVAVSVVAARVYVTVVDNAEQRAKNSFQQTLSEYNECQQAPTTLGVVPPATYPEPTDGGPRSDLLKTLQDGLAQMCADVAQPRDAYVQQQTRQQDAAIAAARSEAARNAASTVAWFSGPLGLLFLAVGWDRHGFQRQKRT